MDQFTNPIPPPEVYKKVPFLNSKTAFIGMVASIVLVSLVAVLIFSKSVRQTSKVQSNVSLTKQYENPFDKKTQYVNPFSGSKNPFDNLTQ